MSAGSLATLTQALADDPALVALELASLDQDSLVGVEVALIAHLSSNPGDVVVPTPSLWTVSKPLAALLDAPSDAAAEFLVSCSARIGQRWLLATGWEPLGGPPPRRGPIPPTWASPDVLGQVMSDRIAIAWDRPHLGLTLGGYVHAMFGVLAADRPELARWRSAAARSVTLGRLLAGQDALDQLDALASTGGGADERVELIPHDALAVAIGLIESSGETDHTCGRLLIQLGRLAPGALEWALLSAIAMHQNT